jgi:hypothetical protein
MDSGHEDDKVSLSPPVNTKVYQLQGSVQEGLLACSLMLREHANVGIVPFRQLDGRPVEERAVVVREAQDLIDRVEDVLAEGSKWPAEVDAFLRRHGMQPCWESEAYRAAGEAVGGPAMLAIDTNLASMWKYSISGEEEETKGLSFTTRVLAASLMMWTLLRVKAVLVLRQRLADNVEELKGLEWFTLMLEHVL